MAHRTFRDPLGRLWQVWDVRPATPERRSLSRPALPPTGVERRVQTQYRLLLGPELSNGWLAFETNGDRRRLAPIPAEWEQLPPAELGHLCAEATQIPLPPRTVE